MADLMYSLFEKASLLLVLAFALTRIPALRRALERPKSWRAVLVVSLLFGVLGVVATQFDVEWTIHGAVLHGLVMKLPRTAMLIGPNLVTAAIAGLLGGPLIGLMAGTMIGLFVFWQGGDAVFANALIQALTGVLSGLMARFFSGERVMAPLKALFVGLFVPVLHMGLLLIVSADSPTSIALVNEIGIPLVVTNSIAIAVFTAIIRTALSEEEQRAAIATQSALRIAEAALPYLRQPLSYQTAEHLAHLLFAELPLTAVSVTNCAEVLSHLGAGHDHHKPGQALKMQVAKSALATGTVRVAHDRDTVACEHPNCPIQSGILVPLRRGEEVIGLINLYFARSQPIRAVEMELARGLGDLISQQLALVEAQELRQHLQDMRLRNLQSQVNPHFLFNTLHMISALVRTDPDQARRVIVQLGHFMRHNLRATTSSRISLGQELEHLQAYIDILKVRFQSVIHIVIATDDNIHPVLIPPCSLQPLVENSLKHGLSDLRSGGRIEVEIRWRQDRVHVEVRDNGCGFPHELLGTIGEEPLYRRQHGGFGLYNVNQRLIGLFGPESHLNVTNETTGGCRISFLLPSQTRKEEYA